MEVAAARVRFYTLQHVPPDKQEVSFTHVRRMLETKVKLVKEMVLLLMVLGDMQSTGR